MVCIVWDSSSSTILIATTTAHPGEAHFLPRAELGRRQLEANRRHLAARNCAPQIAEFNAKRKVCHQVFNQVPIILIILHCRLSVPWLSVTTSPRRSMAATSAVRASLDMDKAKGAGFKGMDMVARITKHPLARLLAAPQALGAFPPWLQQQLLVLSRSSSLLPSPRLVPLTLLLRLRRLTAQPTRLFKM